MESRIINIDDNFGCKETLKKMAAKSKTIDIRVRMDGEYYWFEGDWIKQVLPAINFVQVLNDGVRCKWPIEHREDLI